MSSFLLWGFFFVHIIFDSRRLFDYKWLCNSCDIFLFTATSKHSSFFKFLAYIQGSSINRCASIDVKRSLESCDAYEIGHLILDFLDG